MERWRSEFCSHHMFSTFLWSHLWVVSRHSFTLLFIVCPLFLSCSTWVHLNSTLPPPSCLLTTFAISSACVCFKFVSTASSCPGPASRYHVLRVNITLKHTTGCISITTTSPYLASQVSNNNSCYFQDPELSLLRVFTELISFLHSLRGPQVYGLKSLHDRSVIPTRLHRLLLHSGIGIFLLSVSPRPTSGDT
jgi:hypothetical protein